MSSVLIAGPFFVLYMLQDLHLSYFGYGGWLAAGLLGQLLTLQGWGQFGDRFGNKALLSITGFTVPVLPMLYLVSTNLVFLLAVNFLAASFGPVWHWDCKTMYSIRSGRRTARKPSRCIARSMQ